MNIKALPLLLLSIPAMASTIILGMSGMGPVINQRESMQFQSTGGLVELGVGWSGVPDNQSPSYMTCSGVVRLIFSIRRIYFRAIPSLHPLR